MRDNMWLNFRALEKVVSQRAPTQNITGNKHNFHDHIEFQKEDGKTRKYCNSYWEFNWNRI